MSQDRLCAECLHQLRPAIERAVARRVWNGYRDRIAHLVQTHGAVTPFGMLAELKILLVAETGVDLVAE